MRKPRAHTMHLDGPLEGELFMKREGVDPDTHPDEEPEWLENDALGSEDLEDFDYEEDDYEGESEEGE